MFKHRDRADCWSVLVVDDDPVVRHLTRENLRGVDVDGLPLEIDACENTDAARKLIAATEYALIIMDVAIETEFAGLDLVEELKRSPGVGFTQVVVQSATPMTERSGRQAGMSGIADYWRKGEIAPLRMQVLVRGLVRAYATARSLHAEQLYLRKLLFQLPDIVLHVSVDGRIGYRNRVDGNRSSWWRPGTRLPDYLDGQAWATVNGPLVRACNGESSGVLSLDVDDRVLEVRIGPSMDPSHGAVVILTDVTETRSWEDTVATAGKLDVVARMAGGLAHEFNNSLTAVFNSVAAASNRLGPDDEVQALLQTALAASNRMRLVSQDLLNLTGDLGENAELIDVMAHLRSRERIVRTLLGTRLEWSMRLGADPVWVRASGERLDQIVLKLMLYLGESLPDGGRIVLDAQAKVLDHDRPAGDGGHVIKAGSYLRLSIDDNGPGLSADERRRVFDPFSRTNKGSAGGGLGLSAVYLGVRRLGGTITVASTPGIGTRFQVLLPLALPHAGTPKPAVSTKRAPTMAVRPASCMVLSVEDDDDVRPAVRRVLEGAGYTVIEAVDVCHALEQLRVHGSELGLLLSDIRLPDGTGFEVLAAARDRFPDLPVILTSGYTGYDSEIPRMSAVRFLRKPYMPELLLEAAAAMVNRKP